MQPDKQIPYFHYFPMTRIKMAVAQLLYRVLKLFVRNDQRRIRRNGIAYEVDLSEGIDLSLFLFSGFQDHVINTTFFSIPPDGVILDVGANIGSMTLRFARAVPQGHVYAFEPTHYAFAKLSRNLALNPELARHVTTVHSFVSDQVSDQHQMTAYSSWKIDGSDSSIHPLHGGSVQATDAVPVITLDTFCRDHALQRIDLIKIDTDGYELQVLRGASELLMRYRPMVIFEIGLYILEERGDTFEQYFDYLTAHGYTLVNSTNGHTVTMHNYLQEIPLRFAIDMLALPDKGG